MNLHQPIKLGGNTNKAKALNDKYELTLYYSYGVFLFLIVLPKKGGNYEK